MKNVIPSKCSTQWPCSIYKPRPLFLHLHHNNQVFVEFFDIQVQVFTWKLYCAIQLKWWNCFSTEEFCIKHCHERLPILDWSWFQFEIPGVSTSNEQLWESPKAEFYVVREWPHCTMKWAIYSLVFPFRPSNVWKFGTLDPAGYSLAITEARYGDLKLWHVVAEETFSYHTKTST